MVAYYLENEGKSLLNILGPLYLFYGRSKKVETTLNWIHTLISDGSSLTTKTVESHISPTFISSQSCLKVHG